MRSAAPSTLFGRRLVSLTLDFERDGGAAAPETSYETVEKCERFVDIVRTHDVPVTAFIEGEILDKRPELLEPFENIPLEFELHSYNHDACYGTAKDRIQNIERGLDAYTRHFGRAPRGFRAPNGMIWEEELRFLSTIGVEYDASVFPTRLPGRFDFRHMPREPFIYDETNLVEFPFASYTRPRIPFSLSFAQLLGLRAFKALYRLNQVPSPIVFDFHLHDLIRGQWYREQKLKPMERLGYLRAQTMRDPASVFDGIIRWLKKLGYEFVHMSELSDLARRSPLKRVSVRELRS